jgi:glutamate racemase
MSGNASKKPIGVFDSGVGGLTVVRHLARLYPQESIVYFGDTARVPYGTKSPETIERYARQDTEFLLRFEPKLVVVACNTVSALAIPQCQAVAGAIPVYGVLEPGARQAAQATKSGRIGVIGTPATVQSQAYERAIHAIRPDAEVSSIACPLFVPLAEEGWFDHPASELIAREYLSPLLRENIDTLVLGCTHYPLLTPTLRKILGTQIQIIDSGEAVAQAVSSLASSESGPAQDPVIYVSDLSPRFQSIADRFLGRTLFSTIHRHEITGDATSAWPATPASN